MCTLSYIFSFIATNHYTSSKNKCLLYQLPVANVLLVSANYGGIIHAR